MLVYVVYVVTVVVGERLQRRARLPGILNDEQSSSPTETTALLEQAALAQRLRQPDPGVAETCVDGGAAASTVRSEPHEMNSRELAWDGMWARLDPLRRRTVAWSQRTPLNRVTVLLQAPVYVLARLSVPLVLPESPTGDWHRYLATINSLAFPVVLVMVFLKDAFYAESIHRGQLPASLVAAMVSLALAVTVFLTSRNDRPPAYLNALAFAGMLMSLTAIYLITDEIVSVVQSLGVIFKVSDTMVGMTILGVGNGMCDFIGWFINRMEKLLAS